MKRVLQLFILLSAGYTSTAQDLAYKIPQKAFAVASIKTDQLFRLFPVNEFEKSEPGKKLLETLSKEKEITSFQDFGVNLTSTIYYYNHYTDSISYQCVLLPMSDVAKFEKLLGDSTRSRIKQQGDLKYFMQDKNKVQTTWNKEWLFIAGASLNMNFFYEDSAHTAQYGIKRSTYDFYGDEPTEPAELTTEDYAAEPDYAEVDSASAYADSASSVVIEEPPVQIVEAPPVESEYYIPPPAIDNDAVRQNSIKDSLTGVWLNAYSQEIFNKTPSSPSILNNPTYQRSTDKNAVVCFWMSDFQSLYTRFIPYSYMKYSNVLKGYGNLNSRLYMDNQQLRISTEVEVDAKNAAAYKKIYDHKLNKKFLQYIKSDSLIGFMSYAFDSEAYLKELPTLFSNSFGMFPEEVELGGDLLSLLLDEKAVAKVVKGDALVVLTGIHSKEVSYTTYEYDENYERRDTVKTRTEKVPDLLCMFSSDDTQLIEKALAYGVKKGKISQENNIYEIRPGRKFPYDIYLLIKDGIVFIGSSRRDMDQISNGTFQGNADKQQKDLLLKNNMTMFFSPANMRHKLPKEDEYLAAGLDNLFGNMGNVYMRTTGIQGNYLSVDMTADVPKDKENAVKYILSVVENMNRLK